MPLPSDAKIVALAEDLLKQFDSMFGLNPGFRPAHAKGVLLQGTFTAAPGIASLTRAPHVNTKTLPVAVRFSNSSGLPAIPDNDPNADPRGMAIRFYLSEHVHTDIISVSSDGFPTHTGQEFLEFLKAAGTSGPGTPSPTPIEKFLGAHPAALRFVQTPKPAPASFASQGYFGVTAFRFTNGAGVSRFGRYHIVPEASVQHLTPEETKAKGTDYLFQEITERIAKGSVSFLIRVQLASEGDVVDDATIKWPEDREQVDFGRVVLTEIMPQNADAQRHIIFDPIPRVDGIEPSADPLLELRAAVYLLSGRRRRSAQAQMAGA